MDRSEDDSEAREPHEAGDTDDAHEAGRYGYAEAGGGAAVADAAPEARSERWGPDEPGTRALADEPGLPAYLAEFIGTFLLVFFVVCVVSVNSRGGLGFTDFAVIGLVHIFLLAMLVYSLGGTSGAHFNPAVTVALAALRKIAPGDALIYMLVQLAGAVAATLVAKLLLLDEAESALYGATVVSEDYLQGKALGGLLAEAIGTFALMWAIMGVAVNPRGERAWAGLVIGGTLGFAVMTLAPLTGAGFNPARSFGPALVSGEWADFWVYVVGPLAGALLAAVLYSFIVLRPQDRLGRRPVDTLS